MDKLKLSIKNLLNNILKLIKSVWWFMYTPDNNDLQPIDEVKYHKKFIEGRSNEDIERSYNKAWEAKNFEIENYWKRANYFWAFQVAAFAAYFALLNSNSLSSNEEVLYVVTCIGFITSLAWVLINIGSKTWQRHWEKHVDMLEDKITGPLYKIVTVKKTYSVSKINEIVSRFFVVIWVVLAFKYLKENIAPCFSKNLDLAYVEILISFGALYFVLAMFLGKGRGRFKDREINLYQRNYRVVKDN